MANLGVNDVVWAMRPPPLVPLLAEEGTCWARVGIEMGTTYNRKPQRNKRRYLRSHMTLAERILWYSLKGRQILGFKFRRQHGVKKYIVDFYCPELKLAIEADGETHEKDEAKYADVRRQRDIEEEGIRFLRFRDEEILGKADKVVEKIEKEAMRLSSLDRHHHLPRS